jgi:hypothetical protein
MERFLRSAVVDKGRLLCAAQVRAFSLDTFQVFPYSVSNT